ncbi:BTB/POZ and MATH domain-containing protein 1-like [Aegilops tauschii subsp. strangulata]|uniref:BTB/POZ and MATH domain-containing protein 1-like n=1 Tax=Aegilops tauschii subsp. strangulata TaxID=200361 RepID=UPI00098A2493|nr:BTB/POZ and MATH domain-containing protein 1-like [Aegilops tauschii subsp. strangulata]
MSVAGSPDAAGTRTVCMALKIPATTASGDRNQAYIAARRFAVLGYEWQIDYHPNSRYPYHRRKSWVKLRISLVRTPSPDAGAVTAAFTFCLVDPSRTLRPFREVAAHCPGFIQGTSQEVLLVSRAALEASGYLARDGNCFVQCKAVLSRETYTYGGDGAEIAAHPRDLGHDLGDLLRSQKGPDVTLFIGAESFRAHRCVLAARSLVFAAELAGSLMNDAHEVKDTDADAFRALLCFIYTDTLPPQLEQMGRWPETRKEDQEAVSMARRLLEAADRYGVERLKVICEEKVCASVGVGTVATDLVLAERRGYKKLKARCMEFLVASPADMLAVAAAGGCKLLEATCPSVLTEILTAVAARSCQLALGGGALS